jgi:hypothetical protein
MATADLLQGLQDWYRRQCNGTWEHACGISLETLDNPGWLLTIELQATALETTHFDRIDYQSDHDAHDWYQCWVEHKADTPPKFSAAGGPHNLSRMISIFLDWAERHES